MSEILHRVIIETKPEKLYAALTEQAGLSAWWTKAKTSGKQGAPAQFFFGANGEHVVEMNIKQLLPNKKVVWKCTAGPWAETDEFIFTVSEHERGSVVDFANTGWAASDEFYRHCNSKWGFFLAVSLKNYLETGTGRPHPDEPNI